MNADVNRVSHAQCRFCAPLSICIRALLGLMMGLAPFQQIKADPVVMVDFSSSRLLLPGRGTVTHSTSSQTCCCCHSLIRLFDRRVQTECCPFHLTFVCTFRELSLTLFFFCCPKDKKCAQYQKDFVCFMWQDDGRRYWAQFKWMPDSPSEFRRPIHQLDSGRSVTASGELQQWLAQ